MSAVAKRLCTDLIARFGETLVQQLPQQVRLADGYLPLLVRYTFEDAAAKGLRKLTAGHQPLRPVHFTALEMVQREPLLLLHGEPGSGKTTFALHLALHLAGAYVTNVANVANVANLANLANVANVTNMANADWRLDGLHRLVPRNDADPALPEQWQGAAPVPVYLHGGHDPVVLPAGLAADQCLLIIDGLPDHANHVLAQASALAAAHPGLRVLVLATSDTLRSISVPTAFKTHALLPLLASQRDAYLAALPAGRAAGGTIIQRDWQHPALFMLSLALPTTPPSALALVDGWRAALSTSAQPTASAQAKAFLLPYLAARQLAATTPAHIAAQFHTDARRWTLPVRILAQHWAVSGHDAALLNTLFSALLALHNAAATALVADLLAELPAAQRPVLNDDQLAQLRAALLQTVTDPSAPAAARKSAGHHLARYGDPRPLDELVTIQGARFTMGSRLHPNSSPEHPLAVDDFRIGRYPITNAQYAQFTDATGRYWHSASGRDAHLATCPAVDLSWHDARAYCDWLTTQWRISGVIGPEDCVRLPTEPEWEYAARGQQPAGERIVYPWAGGWNAEGGNVEEHGFNEPCPVGLFPAGRAASGCEDMAGQVWEWTSTLWGADMATPSWRYPYSDDGREAPHAEPGLRRVLRGGCFSSGAEKACCTYRGSLEPDGFWRGNGFRIAVSRQP